MQWILILLAMIFAIPTYGISIIILILVMPYLSAKTRREIFPQIIQRALNEKETIINDNVYYEAAERYGMDSKNIIKKEINHINFYELINGEKINVMFSRSATGGLVVSAVNDKELEERIRKKIDSYSKGIFYKI